jgi:type I restriction enzyme S subunit
MEQMVGAHPKTSDWEDSSFGAIAEFINGYGFKPADWSRFGLPIVRIEQMLNPSADNDCYEGQLPDHFRIDNGSLLFSWSATLASVIWDRGPAWLNQHLFGVVPKGNNQVRFLHHLIDFHIERLAGQSHGTTMRHIKRSDLLPYPVKVPKPVEQSRIAAVLDTVDEAIAKTEAVIAKLKQVRAGLLHDLLTRGLDENGQLRDPVAHPEQFQDSPLGRIPKEWRFLPLSEIADVDRGKFGHRPRNDPDFYGGQFSFIQTGDVAMADGDIIRNASQSLNERGASVSKQFPIGTIAVTIAANIGDTAILGSPMYFPDSVVGVVTRAPNVVRWVELALRLAKQRLNALAPQSAQKNINLEFLRPLLVPVPSSAEQKRCSNVYEVVRGEIKAEGTIHEKLTSIKSGLMNDLLTGRVRVPEAITVME